MNKRKIVIPDCLKGKTFLNPGYGPAFRKMLDGQEVMKDFVNSILHLEGMHEATPIQSIFERSIDFFQPENKTIFFDAHVTTADRRYLDIELQRIRHACFVDRVFFYGAYHIIRSKLDFEAGREKVKLKDNEIIRRRFELPEVISVWICKFKPRPDSPEHDDYRDYWTFYSANDLAKEITLPISEKIKYLIIDLPKFIKEHPAIDTRESFWLHLIADGPEAMPQTDDPIYRRALSNLLVINASQELLNKQAEAMTFNYVHEVDDFEAVLADAKNDARREGVADERSRNEAVNNRRVDYLRSQNIPDSLISTMLAIK